MMVGLVVLFLLLTATVLGVLWVLLQRANRYERQLVRRVEGFSKGLRRTKPDAVPFIVLDNPLSKIPSFNRILGRLDLSMKLHRLLEQAGSSMTVGQLVLRTLVLAAVGALAGLKIANPFLKAFLILFLGSFPLLQVHGQRARRLKAFIRAFPDTIDMMTSAIRAGHALNQAMQLVGDEAPDPVGIEFKRTFEQYNLGLNLREALMNLSERIDSLDLKLFVTAILLQRETGGNLTEILEKISYTIRERFKLIGQIKTYTAQGRMSAWILGTLPIAFVCIISTLNPQYLKPLFDDKMGHVLIGLSMFLQVVGFIFIRKIVRIKYQ